MSLASDKGRTWSKDGVLESISKEDEEQLVIWRDRMLDLGRSTEPPNKEAAEAAVDKVYEERGLKPPPHKLWAVSPQAGLDKVNELHNTKGKWYQPCYGAHDLYWLGHWAYCRDVLGLKSEANPDPLIELATHSGGWFWAFENVVVLTERPSTLKLDDNGALHCEDGPAMAWSDDFGLYSWHGTSIPAEWVTTPADKLDPKIALNWENIEQRRCFAEIVGWERVLKQLKPIVVDEDPNPEFGTLLQVDLPDSPGEKFLKVRCGTGRTFVLPVPPEMKTAQEANAWTFQLTAEDLMNLEVRT